MLPIQIRSHHDPSSQLTKQIQRIYLNSFPPEEREDFSEHLRGILEGRVILFVAENEGCLVGFATVSQLTCQPIWFLEYIAVSQELQGQGLGSLLFRHVVEEMRSRGDVSGLLFEVEPAEHEVEEERRMRERRIAFYRKNGADVLPGCEAYRMPNLAGEGSIPMLLMWLPAGIDPGDTPPPRMESLVGCIFADIYARNASDPLLLEILQRMTD
jgi:GNAT superfamily N-acetyltransferase